VLAQTMPFNGTIRASTLVRAEPQGEMSAMARINTFKFIREFTKSPKNQGKYSSICMAVTNNKIVIRLTCNKLEVWNNNKCV
jgi:hypothetical protein